MYIIEINEYVDIQGRITHTNENAMKFKTIDDLLYFMGTHNIEKFNIERIEDEFYPLITTYINERGTLTTDLIEALYFGNKMSALQYMSVHHITDYRITAVERFEVA